MWPRCASLVGRMLFNLGIAHGHGLGAPLGLLVLAGNGSPGLISAEGQTTELGDGVPSRGEVAFSSLHQAASSISP